MSYSTILLRTVLAVILGGIIGIERESKHRPAGFRTHILVCLGAMSIMVLSENMFVKYNTLYGSTPDPARLSAQVISGIGFLGAGAIMRHGSSVKGLTTAASLWVVAAIGLIVGAGFYSLAITVSVVLYVILFAFNKFSIQISQDKNRTLELIIEMGNKPKILGHVNLYFASKEIRILDMQYLHGYDPATQLDDTISVKVIIGVPLIMDYSQVYRGLLKIDGVLKVERV